MQEFIFGACVNTKSDMVAESQAKLGLTPQRFYADPDLIAKLAIEIKEARGQQFCMVPFCHTIEAELLGGNVNLGDETAGARAGEAICEKAEDVLSLEFKPDACERYQNFLKSIEILKSQGEQVMYCVTGPVATLTCLVESRQLFKEWRRNPELMTQILEKISGVFTQTALEASAAGADAIEYSDPPAASSIVGPKFASDLYDNFTKDFVCELANKLPSGNKLYLCPLSATREMLEQKEMPIVTKCPKTIKTMGL